VKTRKEMKEEYRQRKYRMGVFRITNLANGKIFIGSSIDLIAIWHAQKLQLNAGIHPNEQLQSDWKQFGPENFKYDILEEITQEDEPAGGFEREIKAMEDLVNEELQPYNEKGYNRRHHREKL